MKRSYTTYQPYYRQQFKQAGLVGEFLEAIKDFPNFVDGFSERYNALCSDSKVICYNEMLYLKGGCLSLYLPNSDFCDWLISCVKESDCQHYLNLILESLGQLCCFNFPADSKRDSFILALYSGKEMGVYCDDGLKRDGVGVVINGIGRENAGSLTFAFQARPNDISKESLYKWKLIVGVAMYISCFPESLLDGVPSDLKHPSHHKGGKRKTLEISQEVKAQHCSPVGHFRSGHFRVLRSEKFKNKRFQVIFIKETFVNGKAATVQSFEDMDAASS